VDLTVKCNSLRDRMFFQLPNYLSSHPFMQFSAFAPYRSLHNREARTGNTGECMTLSGM